MAKFKKGQSGNPGGRPKEIAEVRELAREQTEFAIETLVRIAGDKKATHAAQVSAASALLDRGWGKPIQAMEHTGKDGGPIETKDADRARDDLLRRLEGIAERAENEETVH